MEKLPPNHNKKPVIEPAEQDKSDLPNLADYAKPIPAEALKSLRLVMCQANHLSLDVGNCADCINPDACEKKVSEVEEFITELHQQKEKGAAKTRQ